MGAPCTTGSRALQDRLEDPLVETYPGAEFVVRVEASEGLPNCPRSIPRLEMVEPSRSVPAADGSAPVPGRERADRACDVLPAGDPARR